MNGADVEQARNRATRILVVEDDLLFLQYYQLFLESKECEVLCCSSLQDCRELLTQQPATIDLAILDNQLTDGQGLTLVNSIKSRFPFAAILMASATDDADFFLQAFKAGINDYVIKPVNMDLLWQKIQAMVQRSRLEQLTLEQSLALSNWKQHEQQQQHLARHLFDVMLEKLNQPQPQVLACVRPSSAFSGDCIIQCQGMDGSLYLFFADATGHGLAAAVSLMPMLQLFPQMAAKALPLANIAFELNKRLNELLPEDRFVASVLLRINPSAQTLEVWNGCMPQVLLLDAQGRVKERVRSTHMALGILDEQEFEALPVTLALPDFSQIIVHSDGLTETPTLAGQLLQEADIIALAQSPSHELMGQLNALLTDPEDDISLCCVDLQHWPQTADLQVGIQQHSQIKYQLDIRGQALAGSDVPGQIAQLLSQQQLPINLVQRVFVLATEMYLNALEHGVLRLDSQIKHQEEGFFHYYQRKEQGLAKLSEQDWIQLELLWCQQNKSIKLSIRDSGPGFQVSASGTADQPDTVEHGRGLKLLHKLADQVDIVPPGNQFVVQLREY